MAAAQVTVIENEAGQVLTSRGYWSRHTGVFAEAHLEGTHPSRDEAMEFERCRALDWFLALSGRNDVSKKTRDEARIIVNQLKSRA